MSISLLSNLEALNSRRHLELTSGQLGKSMERLASGRRVNSAGDDAAGLAISNILEARVRSTQQARRNAMDVLSMAQVAEGGMNETSNLVIRLRELAVQAASDTVSDREREMLQQEATQIQAEVDRLAESTRYFDTQLLNGSASEFTFQVGPDNAESDRISYDASLIDLRASTLGIDGIDLSSADSATEALESIDGAMHQINMPRSTIGAMQFRLHSITNNLLSYEENLTAARSRIVDADLATETANVVKNQVLQRAGMAVMAQANQLPALALKLLD